MSTIEHVGQVPAELAAAVKRGRLRTVQEIDSRRVLDDVVAGDVLVLDNLPGIWTVRAERVTKTRIVVRFDGGLFSFVRATGRRVGIVRPYGTPVGDGSTLPEALSRNYPAFSRDAVFLRRRGAK